MSVDFKELGNSISEIRKEWGYTQKEVYDLSKVSIETQRRIEHGLKEPKISTLERLSLVYKTDLVKLALQTRKRISYFSDDMIKFVNITVWMRDVDLAKKEIDGYVDELETYVDTLEIDDGLEKELFNCFIDFLQVLKDTQTTNVRNKEQNFIVMEKLLFRLNRSGIRYLSDYYLLNLEVTIGLFLCTILKMNNEVQKSFEVLKVLEKGVNNSRIHDRRIEDYYMTIQVNKIINYEINKEFHKGLDICNHLLLGENRLISHLLWKDILFLKGIMMFHLNKEGYDHILATSILIEEGARRDVYLGELEYYGIDIKIP